MSLAIEGRRYQWLAMWSFRLEYRKSAMLVICRAGSLVCARALCLPSLIVCIALQLWALGGRAVAERERDVLAVSIDWKLHQSTPAAYRYDEIGGRESGDGNSQWNAAATPSRWRWASEGIWKVWGPRQFLETNLWSTHETWRTICSTAVIISGGSGKVWRLPKNDIGARTLTLFIVHGCASSKPSRA